MDINSGYKRWFFDRLLIEVSKVDIIRDMADWNKVVEKELNNELDNLLRKTSNFYKIKELMIQKAHTEISVFNMKKYSPTNSRLY